MLGSNFWSGDNILSHLSKMFTNLSRIQRDKIVCNILLFTDLLIDILTLEIL